ncbi:MAG: CRISPR-associated endoribonuclease Cas6 [Methanimicrococcus sp.]|nr:CRISPR-associated endoribonuclease Cas6 [Methanimicrococcus sp.]
MRALLKLKIDKDVVIPFNYQYHLSSMIYHFLNISDSKYAQMLHAYQKYKFFTFSWLDIPSRQITKEGIKSQDGIVFLQLSSPNDDFLSVFLEGLFQEPFLKIGTFDAYPAEIHIIEPPKSFDILKTISPICLRTQEEADGKLKVRDLLPNQSKFYENLKLNLKKKYEMFYNKDCSMNFDLEILSTEPKRIQIKNTFVRCSNLVFSIKGDDEFIRFGYECGFGEKNSMGFGMVEANNNSFKT